MNKSLEISIVDSIASERIKDLAADAAEIAMDSLLKDGIAKDIPIFGTLMKSYAIYTNIKEMLFAKNVYKFLLELKDLSNEKRSAFIEKLREEKKNDERLGHSIIMLMDRADDIEKPKMIGVLFYACAEGRISSHELFRLCNIVENTYIEDLVALKNMGTDQGFNSEQINSYISSGIMVQKLKKPSGMNFGISVGSSAMTNIPDFQLNPSFTTSAYTLAEILFGVERPSHKVTPVDEII